MELEVLGTGAKIIEIRRLLWMNRLQMDCGNNPCDNAHINVAFWSDMVLGVDLHRFRIRNTPTFHLFREFDRF